MTTGPYVGPKNAYRTVQQVIASMANLPITLSSVSLLDTNDPLIKGLSSAVGTGRHLAGVRFSHSGVGGHYIEDAYIYRVAA